jgi:hypothetical protein
MSRKSGTTRRAFSVKGITYQRIADYITEAKKTDPKASVSGLVEDAILERLGETTPEERQKFDEETEKRIEEEKNKPDGPADMEGYIPPIQFF